jgi:holin-like protein
MIKEVFYILFFYFIGELISYFISGFIPGSVIGMMLLFVSLVFQWIKPIKVERISNALTKNMGFFFIPAAVGLMDSLDFIAHHWTIIVTVASVTTLLVMGSVGWVQQIMERKGSKTNE